MSILRVMKDVERSSLEATSLEGDNFPQLTGVTTVELIETREEPVARVTPKVVQELLLRREEVVRQEMVNEKLQHTEIFVEQTGPISKT